MRHIHLYQYQQEKRDRTISYILIQLNTLRNANNKIGGTRSNKYNDESTNHLNYIKTLLSID